MCHAIHRYAEANNKYLKNYNKNEEPSYIRYLDANNLYGWTMSQKLLVKEFKWVKDTVSPDKKHNKVIKLIKKHNEGSDKGYILETDLHSDPPFLPAKMKTNKCKKVVCNLYDKSNYVIHIRSLKQALNNVLILKRVHKVIQFNPILVGFFYGR